MAFFRFLATTFLHQGCFIRIAEIVAFFFAYLLVQLATYGHIFEFYIFGYVSIRAIDLQTQILGLLKFLQKES